MQATVDSDGVLVKDMGIRKSVKRVLPGQGILLAEALQDTLVPLKGNPAVLQGRPDPLWLASTTTAPNPN